MLTNIAVFRRSETLAREEAREAAKRWRYVIKSKQGFYVQDNGHWTMKRDDALCFDTMTAALVHAFAVLELKDEECDIETFFA